MLAPSADQTRTREKGPRFAAIDIGSNSIRLKIAETTPRSDGLPVLNELKHDRHVTRLGEGVFRVEAKISDTAMAETFVVLRGMKESCATHGVGGMRVVATSAVRDAKNHLEFLEGAKRILGVPVEVISGPEEADLVHAGVHAHWPAHPERRSLIVDLGGGSAQLIYGQSGKVIDKVSRPLGAVRLKERFLFHDPPRKSELRQMNKFIDEKLSAAVGRFPADPVHQVIATSGTAKALVCAAHKFQDSHRELADRQALSVQKLKSLYAKMSAIDLKGRRRIPGIGKRRAEVIVPGAAVLKRILVAFGLPALTYSSAGVVDGIIAELAMRGDVPEPTHEEHFHVFLCHNSEEKLAVREIASLLRDQGVLPWLDEEQLQPGMAWQPLLEQQIGKISSAAVFIGREGIGPWHRAELEAFLQQFRDRQCPVIPVILENATKTPELPLFLRGLTWVDFRRKQPDPLRTLIWGITGKRPES